MHRPLHPSLPPSLSPSLPLSIHAVAATIFTITRISVDTSVPPVQALKAQEKEMKEEREAFIRENEERMARRKAYIRALEKDIGRCEVKGRGL